MATVDNHWVWKRDYLIPSRSGAGRDVVEEILTQLASRQWPEHDIFAVHLALEEALANAIKHGNHGDTRKQIEIQCRLAAELLRLEIADQGAGFDPQAIPDPTEPEQLETPCGRGIMLMRCFMSRVKFNARGNRIVLEKIPGSSD